jgi:hypothetical protein
LTQSASQKCAHLTHAPPLRRSREVLHPPAAAAADGVAAPAAACAAEAAPSLARRALSSLFYAALAAALLGAAALHYLAALLWLRLLAPAQSAAVSAVARTSALVLTPVSATAHAGVSLSCFALRASLLALEAATLGARLARETLRFLRSPSPEEVPPTLRAVLRNAARLARDDDARALRATLTRRAGLLARIYDAAEYAASWAFAPANLALTSARYLCVCGAVVMSHPSRCMYMLLHVSRPADSARAPPVARAQARQQPHARRRRARSGREAAAAAGRATAGCCGAKAAATASEAGGAAACASRLARQRLHERRRAGGGGRVQRAVVAIVAGCGRRHRCGDADDDGGGLARTAVGVAARPRRAPAARLNALRARAMRPRRAPPGLSSTGRRSAKNGARRTLERVCERSRSSLR